MGVTITVLKGTAPVSGTKVSLSITSNAGLLSSVKNLTSVTDTTGKANFQPGWDLIGYTWKASATVGLDYGSASGTADGFGDGSGTISIKIDPIGQVSNWVSSGFWTIVMLAFVAGIVILLFKVLSGFLGGWSPGQVASKLDFKGLWDSMKSKVRVVTDKLQFGNGY